MPEPDPSNPPSPRALEILAAEFRWNAGHIFDQASPLYERLAYRIAGDPSLLALAAHAPPHQLAVNLLFAAVHYLLLRGSDDPLTLFYADLVRKPNLQDDAYPVFRAFCLEHAVEIGALVSSRRVQTNEIARCALFLPAFELIARRVERAPLAMIEVGSSAGLNLNWDRYGYVYGNGTLYGDPASPIVLRCEVRGEHLPPLAAPLPRVFLRTGVDLNPNDVRDEDATLWLRALVWPEQRERAERLEQAIALARRFPQPIITGDALDVVPDLLDDIPPATPVVLFHSFVLNQFPSDGRTRYYEMLAAQSRTHILFDLSVEPHAWPVPLVLTTFRSGERAAETLALCDHHGRWLEWNPNAALV
jgi:hypothetical protein